MRRALLGLALLVPLLVVAPAAAKPGQGAKKIGAAANGKGGTAGKKSLRVGKSGPVRKKGKGRRKRREVPPQMPQQIELTAIDLVTGTAHVEVVGTTRPPVTQLFILTDQSGRRFVPHFAECHPPPGITLAAAAPRAGQDPSPESSGPDGDEDGDEDEPPLPAGTRELPATTRWRCNLTIPRLYRRAPLASLSMEWGAQRIAASDQVVQRLWGEARAAAPLAAVAERSDARPAEPSPPPAGDPPPAAAASPTPAGEPGEADPKPDKEPATHASRSGRSGE